MTARNAKRPVYKASPVGPIPADWDCRPFTDIFVRAAMPLAPEPAKEYREIGIRSHGKGVFHKDPVTGAALGDKRVFHCVPGALAFNIVFAWEQAVALVSAAERDMIASHRFPMYKGKDGAAHEPFYLWYFKSTRGKHALGLASPGGAGRNKTLGQGELDFLQLPVPPVSEQRKIAAILATWDTALEQTRALLSEAKRRKVALVQQLLTGTMRLPRFSGKWRRAKLEELCDINPSNTSDRHALSDSASIPFLKMEDVTEGGRIKAFRHIPSFSATSGYPLFRDGDILLAKITPCFENGKGCLVNGVPGGIGLGSTEFHTLRARACIMPELVYQVSQSPTFRQRGEAYMTGSAGQKRVPAEFLASYTMGLPPLPEQRAIAAVLTAADDEIHDLERQLAALERQKKGLMQKLLTGEVRVKT